MSSLKLNATTNNLKSEKQKELTTTQIKSQLVAIQHQRKIENQ